MQTFHPCTASLLCAALLLSLSGTARSLAQPLVEPTTLPATPASAPVAPTAAEAAKAATDAKPAGDPADPAIANAIFARLIEGKPARTMPPTTKLTRIKLNEVLNEQMEIVTGLNDLVQLQIGKGQLLTVDRNSRVFISQALKTATTDTTKIEMAYGRVKFDVNAAGTANNVEIKTPDATLAVKGTSGGMQYSPDTGSFGYGGDFNGGRINVLWNDRQNIAMGGNETTTPEKFSTASQEQFNLYVDISDPKARDRDETKFAQDRIAGANFTGSTGTIPPTDARSPIANGLSYFAMNSLGNVLAELDLTGLPFRVDSDYRGFAANPIAGTLVRDSDTGQLKIFTVESISNGPTTGPTAVIRAYSIGSSNRVYSETARFAEVGFFGRTSWELSGLAVMGGQMYASGTTYTNFGAGGDQVIERGNIYDISVTTNRSPIAIMNLGMDLQRGMTGSNERGSMFITGSLTSTTFGFGANRSFLILEIDPRSNLILDAGSNLTGQINPVAGSPMSGMTSVSGMSFISGLLILTGSDVFGNSIRVSYNPSATNSATDPRIVSQTITGIGPSAQRTNLGTDIAATLPGTRNLLPVRTDLDPARDDINQLFAQMAYTTTARQSGVINLLVREQIISTALNPSVARTSGALELLPAILAQHDNMRSGVGLTIAQFRNQIMNSPYRDLLPPSLRGGGN